MKNILASLSRHAIGAVGAILAWAATADVDAISSVFENIQLIIGALMTIGAAASGIWSSVQKKRAKQESAMLSAKIGSPVIANAAGKINVAETEKTVDIAYYGRSGG